MLIATTNEDHANIVACTTAKTLSDVFTVGRVKRTQFLTTWERSEKKGAMGVDYMVCSDLQTAKAVVWVTTLPAAKDVDLFADGRVQMVEFEINEASPVAGMTVENADVLDSLTFAALLRDGEVILPRGDTVIREGDSVIVIGSVESTQKFSNRLMSGSIDDDSHDEEHGDIVIVGGSQTGYHTARLLEERGYQPKLIESDPERARRLAEDLPGTVVMESDATDIEFLKREGIDRADVVISALDTDEKSLLVSLLTKRLGAERSVAVVEQGSYVDLFETVGVDVGVNPRKITAEKITRSRVTTVPRTSP